MNDCNSNIHCMYDKLKLVLRSVSFFDDENNIPQFKVFYQKILEMAYIFRITALKI